MIPRLVPARPRIHAHRRLGLRRAGTVVSEGLVAPTGVAVSHRGHAYVSNYGAAAGIGEVVRVRP